MQNDTALSPCQSAVPNGVGVTSAVVPGADAGASDRREGHVTRLLRALVRSIPTAVIAVAALVIALLAWQYYVLSPWTRDGTIRVQVANVASQVSGQIVEVHVADNQFVHAGDVLYVIEPFDFEVAVHTAKALVDERAADLEVKQTESQRRQKLSSLATTPEEQQIYAGNAAQAKSAYDAAAQQLAQAEVNLKRTRVVSPVDGYVTNLLLRVGDFAQTGSSNVSVIDSTSYWLDGYFEETKLAKICIGDRAEAKLMGYSEPLVGHVVSITRGISVANAGGAVQGLPDVDPIYTWVRLAQRVPVRINIDHVPTGVPLVGGLTATVTIIQHDRPPQATWSDRLADAFSDIPAKVTEIAYGAPPPSATCLADRLHGDGEKQQVPVPPEVSPPSPAQIEPGLTPGLNRSPLPPVRPKP